MTVQELRDLVGKIKCNTESPYFFICYQRRDEETVLRDAVKFNELGYNFWIDIHGVSKQEETYKRSTLPAIDSKQCKLILFYLSKNSLSSEPVYREIEHSQENIITLKNHGNRPVSFVVVEVNGDVYDLSDAYDHVKADLEANRDTDGNEKTDKKLRVVDDFYRYIFSCGNDKPRVHPIDYHKRVSSTQYYEEIADEIDECCKRPEESTEDLFDESEADEPVTNETTAETMKKMGELAQKLESETEKTEKVLHLEEGLYKGQVRNGTANGEGVLYYNSGATYTGSFEDGVPNGQGRMEKDNGDIVEGSFVDGQACGHCKKTCIDGTVYEGQVRNGRLNGRGVAIHSKGFTYEGMFADGKPNGNGTMTYANKDRYEGHFADGKKEGSGKYTFANGDVFEGNYVDDKREGSGRCTYANGDVFEGEYKDGRRNGPGTMIYANGDLFAGEYEDDNWNGPGKLVRASGLRYDGNYKDGKPHGSGKMLYVNKDRYEGDFVEGKRDGHGKYTYANGDVFEGDYKDGLRNGHGTMVYANGNRFEGEYRDGKKNGPCKESFANGDAFEGNNTDDKRDGPGKYTYANGDVYEGGYKDGRCFGHGKMIYVNGGLFEGEYRDGKRNGPGRYTSANGDVFEGSYTDDNANGPGKKICVDGSSFEGKYKDGRINDKACLHIYPNGNTNIEERSEGKQNGHSRELYISGGYLECDYIDGKRHGSGFNVKPDGSILLLEYDKGELLSNKTTGNRAPSAQKYYQSVLDSLKDLPVEIRKRFRLQSANANCHLGVILYQNKETEKALAHINKGIGRYEELSKEDRDKCYFGYVDCLRILASREYDNGRHESAKERYLKALSVLDERLGTDKDKSSFKTLYRNCCYGISDVLKITGFSNKAEEYIQKGKDVFSGKSSS